MTHGGGAGAVAGAGGAAAGSVDDELQATSVPAMMTAQCEVEIRINSPWTGGLAPPAGLVKQKGEENGKRTLRPVALD